MSLMNVIDGKIFGANLLASKNYILRTIGYSKVKGEEGKIVDEEHKRSKRVSKEKQDELTFEEYEDMLFNHNPITVKDNKRFAKSFKNMKEPAIKTIKTPKTINSKPWERGKLDIVNNRWLLLDKDP